MSTDPKSPIGIFDSGIGGLTVVKSVMRALPGEKVIYFGDTARVPYGIKSEDTVRRYALEITDFLLEQNVKMILIACNTVSATARKQIVTRAAPIPVLDVITAGVDAALKTNMTKGVAVIGTLATIGSGAYQSQLQAKTAAISVQAKACPMLVPLAEEGWVDNSIAIDTLREYLKEIDFELLDSLILGCTHYPLFKESIRQILSDSGISVSIIDSAESIAHTALYYLEEHQLLNNNNSSIFNCYVSDRPQRFHELAERFLGHKIRSPQIIKLEH